jgi:hypothetical protein
MSPVVEDLTGLRGGVTDYFEKDRFSNRRNALTSSLITNHYISRALPKRNEEARLVGRGTMIPDKWTRLSV